MQVRKSLFSLRATGLEATIPCHLALLAQACGEAEQYEEGLQAIAEALTMVNSRSEHNYEAELYRLKGELQLQRDPASRDDAEACFEKAISIARGQQAKSLELRAALSLGKLWHRDGKRAEARALLAPIYSWFTEGFDTADLRTARALLDELRE